MRAWSVLAEPPPLDEARQKTHKRTLEPSKERIDEHAEQ
jgi:hypothetical protein